MKRALLFTLLLATAITGFAQDVMLADSVIYFDKKPVAFYHTTISNHLPRYNIVIEALNGQHLIKADIIEFTAPVTELKSFYYYNLQFPAIKDTFSIYHDGEAFTLALAGLMADYHLLSGNTISAAAVKNLKETYPGGAALTARINEVTDYLNLTRHFEEQVIRDRTKPVTIVNERVIMQDGVKIGTINTGSSFSNAKSTPVYVTEQVATYGKPTTSVNRFVGSATISNNNPNIEIHFPNGQQIDFSNVRNTFSSMNKKGEIGYQLFEKSRKKKYPVGSGTEELLRFICFLVDDHDL
jgi:hypothetical protein